MHFVYVLTFGHLVDVDIKAQHEGAHHKAKSRTNRRDSQEDACRGNHSQTCHPSCGINTVAWKIILIVWFLPQIILRS